VETTDGDGPTGTAPVGPPSQHAPATFWSRVNRARYRFRAWRRSRPFWGGLLLLLAGLELIAIPLLSVLAHGSVKVVIYIGIGGIFGVLIGGLLAACGLLVWFHPVQRVFYSVAGVLLAVASFVATNLGGFFLGMLLGVTGASLSFGWTSGPAPAAGQYRPRRARTSSPGGLGQLFGDRSRAGGEPPSGGVAAPGTADPSGGVREAENHEAGRAM
jgi:hypothetical protein